MKLCRKLGVLYVDTVVEPWLGFYFDDKADNASRTNYALRETVREEQKKKPGGTTAVSCCGANPGMVSWFVKQALVNLATDLGLDFKEPAQDDREGWAKLMKKAGVKGIHIAERDTQRTKRPKPMNVFWNTWSVEGFISEGMQPAELGWGTHEKWMPKNAKKHKHGSKAAIYLEQPGANTRVRTLVPDAGRALRLPRHPQRGDLDRRLLHRARQEGQGQLPADLPLRLSPMQRRGAVAARDVRRGRQARSRSITCSTSTSWSTAADELGVLLYGHDKNAYWYGSQLTLEEARELAPYQNATGLQVTSAVLAAHGLGAGEPARPASSRPTRWTTGAASKCNCPISARSTATTPTGPRSKDGRDCFPKTSTRRIPGSSATFWCVSGRPATPCNRPEIGRLNCRIGQGEDLP